MMRRPNLLSCYATASSLASARRVHSSSISNHFSGTKPAFVPLQSIGLARGTLRQYFSTNRCHYARRHSESILPPDRAHWTRQFGSKSTNFRQRFLKPNAKNSQEEEEEDMDAWMKENHGKGGKKDIRKLKGQDDAEEEEEEPDDYNYEPKNDIIQTQTMDWIKKVVIGYNLCPFAERPLREDKLKISVVRGNNDEWVASAVVYELIARSDESQPGTTVVVAPEYYPEEFSSYMSLLKYIEDDFMDEHDLHGLVQIAPFHPKFEFAGSGEDGIDNYTNRSPYPMFHILREDEVGGAVEKLGGDASRVWSRNVKLLERMKERWGKEGVERAMRGEDVEGTDALLKEVKLTGYRDKDED